MVGRRIWIRVGIWDVVGGVGCKHVGAMLGVIGRCRRRRRRGRRILLVSSSAAGNVPH
jgi:glutamate 5-kinase